MRKFPYHIGKENGAADNYSIEQIDTIINNYRFNKQYRCYAYAMFLSKQDYNTVCEKRGITTSYDDCRCELANIYFDGNTHFHFVDLIEQSQYRQWVIANDSQPGGYQFETNFG